MQPDATAAMAGTDDDGPRALVTNRELEILHGDADVSKKYYHVVVTRVRKRINRLEEEIAALDVHDSLGDELRDVVCGDGDSE